MRLTIEVQENKAAVLMDLLKKLDFVTILPPETNSYLDVAMDMLAAMDEVKLHKSGQKKLRSAKALLDEL